MSFRFRAIPLVLLPLALVQLVLSLAADHAAPAGLEGMPRALLACALLPAPGLLPALLVLARRRAGGTPPEVGALALLGLSLGLSLLLDFVLAVVIRAAAPPLTALPISVAALGSVLLALAADSRLGRPGVRAEPGLGGWPLVLALVIALGFAVGNGRRLFGGLGRLVLVQPERWFPILTGRAPPPLPRAVTIRPAGGLREISAGELEATRPDLYLQADNATGRGGRFQLRLVVSGKPPLRLNLLEPTGGRCRGSAAPAAAVTSALASVDLPGRLDHYELRDIWPRPRVLLAAGVWLEPGESCLRLRVERPTWPPPGRVTLHDISHDSLRQLDIAGGTLSLIDAMFLECHVSDASYRNEMRQRNVVDANLLLWGYFTQLVVEVLAGAAHPALGVLFLVFALLCFMAAQVLVGAAAGGGGAPHGRLAGLLLLGPFSAHLASLIDNRALAFAFPDTSYAVFVLGAVALLVRRERVGFIVLGCLAGYTRYPGGYVMLLALLGWLVLQVRDRAWTRRTLAWSLLAGGAVVAALMVYFVATTSLQDFFSSVYDEVIPEHFTPPATDLVAIPPLWGRAAIFCLKLLLLSCFTPLFWPLVRHPVGKLLVLVTAGYAVTLMFIVFPNSHYFPPLLYMAAAASVGALARSRRRLPLLAAAALALAGALLGFGVDSIVANFYRP
jgi:hypothetical protein